MLIINSALHHFEERSKLFVFLDCFGLRPPMTFRFYSLIHLLILTRRVRMKHACV